MNELRILIVEDDKNMQALYKLALTADLFDARYSYSGTDALEVYRSWKPEIIILDIMLPGMTGYSVLEEIRLKDRDAATVIIMATSMADRSDIEDCRKLGIQGYIIKPINLKEIANKIIHLYQEAQGSRGR